MAKAYQCDRCMQYYTANKENLVPGMGTDKIATGMCYTFPHGNDGFDVTKQYQLCDDCLKKLIDFIAYRGVN